MTPAGALQASPHCSNRLLQDVSLLRYPMVSEALLTWAAAVKDSITPARALGVINIYYIDINYPYRARGITCSSSTSSIAHLPLHLALLTLSS